MEAMEIEEEFLNRTTDRANKLIAKIFLYSNFVCVIFLIAHYFDFFNMSYTYTLIIWALIIYFSVSMFLFCRLNVSRSFTMYHGLLGVVVVISAMGANSAIGVNISYAVATLFSCLYLVKRYTIVASTVGYLGMVVSLFIKSRTMYLVDMTSDTPMEYFNPILAGFTIEYIILLLACTSITSILRQTVYELQERTERIRRMQTKELQTFANIVECRDKFTGEHIERTSIYVELIARELAKTEKYRNILTREVVNIIIEAAPLHDIGKIQIPDNILKKPGRLTADEYEVMKTHSEIGYNMIGSYLPEIIDEELLMYSEMMALHHHERYDGKGYPKGIMGESIPLCARIMSVADVLDALLSKRHYKESYPLEKAIDIIKEERGKMFDPDVVDSLLNVIPKIKELENQAQEIELIEEL
ncbi:HD-GYP domain-containing protein [Treponema sp.]|uniref:HD-GYP domain-containing protein n=1 Tax=Treponema sp. TaxID=166 RepID=UPI00388F3BD1